jgi:hypothetical protein
MSSSTDRNDLNDFNDFNDCNGSRWYVVQSKPYGGA